jgi:hypothetical protein
MHTFLKAFLLFFFGLALLSCSSNPHKAKSIETEIEKKDQISGDTSVGVNKDGNMVVLKKVAMNEELRRLQYEVYEKEDQVYGNRKYGSLGLYGVLRDCRMQLSDPKLGGDGKLKWTEPMERITDKEEDFKVGLDEKEKLVGVSEEFLKDRISRFRGYKQVLMSREDEYEEKVQICKADLKAKKSSLIQSPEVTK